MEKIWGTSLVQYMNFNLSKIHNNCRYDSVCILLTSDILNFI